MTDPIPVDAPAVVAPAPPAITPKATLLRHIIGAQSSIVLAKQVLIEVSQLAHDTDTYRVLSKIELELRELLLQANKLRIS